MVTTLQPKTPHTIKLDFSEEPVTSFGGLVLAEKTAARLRLWSTLAGLLPARQGGLQLARRDQVDDHGTAQRRPGHLRHPGPAPG